jgi:hypothetical protein
VGLRAGLDRCGKSLGIFVSKILQWPVPDVDSCALEEKEGEEAEEEIMNRA